MPDIDLSIVMPSYEEAENLSHLLPALKKEINALGISYEILVVDTEQPRDKTPEVCAENNVRYVPRHGGGLYGHAIRTGIAEANGTYIIIMDSDGSHNPNFIPRLWEQRSHDLVIASRYIAGGHTENSFILVFMSLIVNVVFRWVLGLTCADVSNSFRLYHAGQLKKLQLNCDHFDIVEEILVKLSCAKKGFSIKEIPFTFEKRQAGKTKRKLIAFAIGYIGTLWRLYQMRLAVHAK